MYLVGHKNKENDVKLKGLFLVRDYYSSVGLANHQYRCCIWDAGWSSCWHGGINR